jgi:hypothetical protein
VLDLEVLIGELVAVDAGAAGAVAVEEVAALDHEALDHSVEVRTLVANRLAVLQVLACAELSAQFQQLID